jgi:hypothetical protein
MERAVVAAARSFLEDKPAVLAALQESGIEVPDVRQVFELASDCSRRLLSATEGVATLIVLIERIDLTASGIRVGLNIPFPSVAGETSLRSLRVSRFAPMKLKRRGVELRIILDGKDDLPRKAGPALLKAVARARRWFEEIASGRVSSSAAIARREALPKGYLARLTRLAFLSPAIIDAMAEGRALVGLNLQMLMTRRVALPLQWKDQQRCSRSSSESETFARLYQRGAGSKPLTAHCSGR